MKANLYALAAIALWASLSTLGVALRHVPPFLLTGVALGVGSVLAWPAVLRDWRQWQMAPLTLGLGVSSLFGFHFLLFMALRLAPAVEVTLINYLWPLLMVVLAPRYLPGLHLHRRHLLAAALGLAGAGIAIWGGRDGAHATPGSPDWRAPLGYLMALGSACVWANFSLQTRRLALQRRGFTTAAIGLFGLVSSALSLLCHWALEPSVRLSGPDGLWLAVLGLGPLGAAFYWWDKALKLGDARQIGILSYLTPLAATALLLLVSGRALSLSMALAAGLILAAAVLGTRVR